MKTLIRLRSVVVLMAAAAICASVARAQQADPEVDPNDLAHLHRLGSRGIRVHDPSTIIKCRDEYWIFCTGRGISTFALRPLTWDEEGWPVAGVEELPK